MNLTLTAYDQSVDFGIVACRRSMPHVQRVIEYMEQALVELEDAGGADCTAEKDRSEARKKTRPVTKKTRTKTPSKSPARKKARSKSVARDNAAQP